MSRQEKHNDPLAMGAHCGDCPFSKDGRPNRPVLAEGPAGALGVLVGESPGLEEYETGRPFVGATGHQLDRELLEAGIARDSMLVVNAVACLPPKGKTEAQMHKAVLACRPAFLTQIGRASPRAHFFGMGKWAYGALTLKFKGVAHARGFIRKKFTVAPQGGKQ